MPVFARTIGIALLLALAPLCAHAAFSGYYAPSNWTITLTGSPAGGGPPVGVDLSGAPGSIRIVGGDSAVGRDCWNDDLPLDQQRLGCAIHYTIVAPASGQVSFAWAYETIDNPYWDAFGFVLDGVVTMLTDGQGAQVQNGVFSIDVLAGQTFGFWFDCGDCGYGNGWADIRDFSAPAAAPEPATLALVALGLATIGAARRRAFARE